MWARIEERLCRYYSEVPDIHGYSSHSNTQYLVASLAHGLAIGIGLAAAAYGTGFWPAVLAINPQFVFLEAS